MCVVRGGQPAEAGRASQTSDSAERCKARKVYYMRNLLGWLETRLAQNTSNYLGIAKLTLNNKPTA